MRNNIFVKLPLLLEIAFLAGALYYLPGVSYGYSYLKARHAPAASSYRTNG